MLLDTHVFIWLAVNPERLPAPLLATLKNTPSLFVSVISLTEIVIKHRKNPGAFPFSPDHAQKALSAMQLSALDYTVRHAQYLARLPAVHADPFDRMLIAQALAENLPLVSADQDIAKYENEYQSLEGAALHFQVISCA